MEERVREPTTQAVPPTGTVELKHDALGLAESVVMGVAGTAPAFSAAATTAALIASVGTAAPASLLSCGFIMFGITLVYMHLNRLHPNAGASYAWVGREFGRLPGFLAGWALLVASALFMVSGTIPAATATLLLIAPAAANDPAAVTFVAAGWLLAVGAVLVKGIKVSSYVQVAMTAVEVAALVAVIVLALVDSGGGIGHRISPGWFSLAAFTPQSFANGALTALFFFWGWDVTVNLTEETRDASRAPGLGAVIAMVIVLLLFVGFVTAALAALTDAEIQGSGTNVVFAVADRILPRPWSYVAILAVLLSTAGTLETSILQFTRTMYAKGRDGVLHRRYAVLHQTWRTPWVATVVIVVIGLALLLLASGFPTVNLIIRDSVNAIGFQVAFYYGLAGLACVWHYRRSALRNLHNLLVLFLWPLLSVLFLAFIAIYSIPVFDLTTDLMGLGGIAVGIVPYLLNRPRRKAAPALRRQQDQDVAE